MFGFLKRLFRKDDKPKFTKDEVKVLREFLKQSRDTIGPLATKEWVSDNFMPKFTVGDGLYFNSSNNTLRLNIGNGLSIVDEKLVLSDIIIKDLNYNENTHKLSAVKSDGSTEDIFTAVPEWS